MYTVAKHHYVLSMQCVSITTYACATTLNLASSKEYKRHITSKAKLTARMTPGSEEPLDRSASKKWHIKEER